MGGDGKGELGKRKAAGEHEGWAGCELAEQDMLGIRLLDVSGLRKKGSAVGLLLRAPPNDRVVYACWEGS